MTLPGCALCREYRDGHEHESSGLREDVFVSSANLQDAGPLQYAQMVVQRARLELDGLLKIVV